MAELACGDLVLHGPGNGYWGYRGTDGWHFGYWVPANALGIATVTSGEGGREHSAHEGAGPDARGGRGVLRTLGGPLVGRLPAP